VRGLEAAASAWWWLLPEEASGQTADMLPQRGDLHERFVLADVCTCVGWKTSYTGHARRASRPWSRGAAEEECLAVLAVVPPCSSC
jgi:hypothetical protein